MEYASEFRYRNPVISSEDVVIAISQSGETADTLAAVQLAKERGAFIYGICNVVGSSIARATHTGSYIHVGPEIGVASTKAFTGQVTVLTMLALALAKEKGAIQDSQFLEIVQELTYAFGCGFEGEDRSGFAEAVEAARQSDVVLLFVGSASASLARDYRNATCGEGYDLTDLNLTGVQGELVKQLYGTGKPVVLVVVTGRPFSIAWEKEHIPAILFQWYGGEREGEVIADVLFGKVNPSGRLCYSIPQSVGHLPVHYNRLPSDNGFYRSPGSLNKPGRDYVFSAPEPLWPFGFGLSYADFAYENFKVDKESYQYSDTIRVTAALRNLSDREGKSVMQVYVKDVYSSVVMPVKQLKGIAKVSVPAQSTVKAHVAIPVSELGLYNAEMKYVVEPGEFQIMVGTSSADILFTQSIHVGQPIMTGETSLTENQTTKKAQASGKPMVVKGTIRDVQATLLAGVCVKVKGSKSETVSDAQGQYTLRCRSTDTLVFSKEGYGEQTVDVDGQEQLNMTME